MAGDARRSTVGDYVTLVRGTTYKGQLVGEPGPALLGLGSIEPGGGFRVGNYKTYGGECPDELMLFPGDVYASLKGATKDGKMIGSVARVPTSVPTGRLTQDTVKLVFRTPNSEDETYLYWVLRTPQYRDYCAGHAMGSAVVALSRRDFLSYPVPPPSAGRRMVVALLDEIEEIIELNRRMNESLEAMVRAIFESWFVDFDPVRAKAEGRDPGLPKPLADLFPARLVDSEFGEIPEGWRTSVLGEELTRCGGRIQTGPFGSQLHASDYVDDGVPVVMPKDLSRRRVSTLSIAMVNINDAERLSRHRLQQGDIVYSRRGDVEQHGLVHRREAGWLCGTGCLLVRPGPAWPSPLWVSNALDRPESRAWIVQHAIGATMPNLNTGILANVPLVVPPDEILWAFDRVARPLADRVISADAQTTTLVSLRDMLLPKLISGEIRVKDSARAMGTC